ncbi:hypothetical protein DFH06DRAFT_565811 [Mycena polygramma]|nr:hypothetical protein DFH06DRAFT_565811 [Mycena polygramma]
MPFFQSPSNFQIYGGHFTDVAGPSLQIGGDLNLHLAQPAIRQQDALEFAFSEGTSRLMSGVERNGRQAGTARPLPYDASHRPRMRALQSSESYDVRDEPLPRDSGGELSLAPIANGPPWGGPPYGPKTNINVSGNMNNIQRQGESGFHILHRAIAGDAFHDAAERRPQPSCHPETRTEMLEDLYRWSNLGSSILWLYGPAGAGKSAIAQSFCQRLAAEGRLGASFFFKRGHSSRGSGKRMFSTIAYQLVLCLPGLKQIISQIVEDDPSILDRALSTQLQKLIIEPCQRIVQSRPLAVVIDGLDECEDQSIQREILILLGKAISEHPLPFQLFIASRPEPHIHEIFSRGALKDISRPLNIQQSFLDVHTYLKDQLARVQREHCETMAMVPGPWPSASIIEKLTDNSSGYFVYAATVVRFIDDRDFRPTERLDVIMGIRGVASEAPFAALDDLYIQILSSVPASKHSQLLEILTVIAAKFNLSGLHIEQLLELQPGDVGLILRQLHSILNVQHAHMRITVHHASFLDFLDDSTRSGAFHIGDFQRMNLASHILKAFSLDVDPSADHIAWQLGQVEFGYVTFVQPTPELVSLLHSFNTDCLVFPNVHHVVRRVLSWLRRSQPLPHDLVQLWGDYEAIVTSGVRSASRLKARSAEEAVKLRRKLAETDPLVIKDLAHALHDLGVHLTDGGQHEAAVRANEEAVQIYRKLAETNPTVTKYLAHSLHNLGTNLSNTGQYGAALCAHKEALKLRHDLAEPDPTLAHALHNLGLELRNIKEYEAAVCANQEAVELYRKQAEANPSVTNHLAKALHNLGVDLGKLGRNEDALRADEEAVKLRRKLAETDPSITENLASSIHNLGTDLCRLGRHHDALSADAEAVNIFRKLAETDPAVTLDLANSLHNLGVDLGAVGRNEDAMSAAEEAVDLYSTQNQTVQTQLNLARALIQWAIYLRVLYHQEDYMHICEKGVGVYRNLRAESTADNLLFLAQTFSAAGLYQEALQAAGESMELYRRLTPTNSALMKDLIKAQRAYTRTAAKRTRRARRPPGKC